MTIAKIHLSKQESELVNNKEWLFSKQEIIDKVFHLLGNINQRYRQIVEKEKIFLPVQFQKPGGKISRGENYKGLPFLILDYPAIFGKENIFAVRTMFWWGNHFSITLHLSGKYIPGKKDILHLISFFRQHDYLVCVNESQWEHTFEAGNFIAFDQLNSKHLATIATGNFLKVAKKIDLNRWDEVPEFLENSFTEIVQFLKFNFPLYGGKDL